ncbi:MAG: arginine decarboxylase [Firmicutes bacterium]|nr:arginine decarboxylase [Bacillota bacterium]MBO2521564.1 arginine decarboxylase [Bacillota bacterium]
MDQERTENPAGRVSVAVAAEQDRAPLFDGLREYARKNRIPFHIPGHKRGRGMDPEFRAFLGENALSIDLVNIAPVDDLHLPRGMIKEAQELAAQAFGAERTFFSVQGTSGAIMAMVLAAVGPGDKILIPRNAHKSVWTAVVLSGAQPVFMEPEIDPVRGVAHGVCLATVERTLEEHPDAKAVLVVNPTYFGVCADLRGIAEVVHRRGIPLLVDEAHGAHLYFHPALPCSAMAAGADAAATSMHKLGGSLIQSSILNLQGGRLSSDRVQAVLSMLTTTSTSYILLASLDAARRYLATWGEELLTRAIALAQRARREIGAIPGLECLGPEVIGDRSSSYDLDPTKLCVTVTGLGLSGIEVEVLLREEHGIEVELSDLYNILCLITPGDGEESVCRLVEALRAISREHYRKRPATPVVVKTPEVPPLAMSPRDAFYAPAEPVPLFESEGRIMAEFIMVYPPGIPLLLPGERITRGALDYIREHLEAGLPVQGPEDPTLQTIRVVARA